MPSMKRYFFVVMFAVVVVVVINLVAFALESPKDADQSEIEKCWEESKVSHLTAEKRQVVIGACQALEKVFQLNYGTKLTPGFKDV